MSEQSVLYQLHGKTALITLNRPKQLNSLTGDLVSELLKCLNNAETDPAVRAVVLTGAGRAFCAGGDLEYLDTLLTENDRTLFIAKVGSIIKTIFEMSKPVVGMVNGVAAGAGANLAIACDVVFAADTVKFVQSFAKVGLAPDCGGYYILPRIVGLLKAKELMFTADAITAQEALELKLVNRVLPVEELNDNVMEFANALACSAPLAIGMMKKALNNTYNVSLPESLEAEASINGMLLSTTDFTEGVKAFKEKRMPEFIGK